MQVEWDGADLITSPILAGFGDTVAAAAGCEHQYEPLPAQAAPHEELPGVIMQMEQCCKCRVAMRSRIVGPKDLLIKVQEDLDGC